MSKKQNLKWELNVLRAKAGLPSKMAVPKRIAQKARSKLKRAHEGALPSMSGSQLQRTLQLEQKQAKARVRHLIKQLRQGIKKARTFLLRKLLRKAREHTDVVPSALEYKLRVLKALPLADVTRSAQLELGIEVDEAPRRPPASTWEDLRSELPVICVQLEHQLLGSALVRTHLLRLQEALKESQRREEEQPPTSIPVTDQRHRGDRNGASQRTQRKHTSAMSGTTFLESLADLDGTDTCRSEGEDTSPDGDALVLGGARESFDEHAIKRKRKHVISASGNRMGQRQRRKLAEGVLHAVHAVHVEQERSQWPPQRSASEDDRCDDNRAKGSSGQNGNWRSEGDDVWRTQPERIAEDKAVHQPTRTNDKAAAPRTAHRLHPSWAAKRQGRDQASIKVFKGTHKVFE